MPEPLVPEVPLFQRRPFRMLSFTRFASRLAQNALSFGLVLLIVDETGKALFSSMLVLALVIPSTVAGIIAGTAADVLPKRLLVVFGDLARAGACLAFVWAGPSVAAYYAVAVGLSIFGQFSTSAEGAILPAIVPRQELAKANAIGHAVGGAAQVLGFGVLAPVMLRVFHSPEALFVAAAGLFVAASVYAVAIGRVVRPARKEVGGSLAGPWWKTGWLQMKADPVVMHAAIELTLISTALIILGGLIPKFIEDVLHLPVDVGALVLLPAAIGVALGLRIASFLAHRVPHAALSRVGFVTFVALLCVLTFVNQVADFLGGYGLFGWLNDINIGSFEGGGALAMIIVLPLGFAYALVSVAAQTVLNDSVPMYLQGRVLATQGAIAALASSVPVLVAGALSDLAGVTTVMALLSAAIAFAAIVIVRGSHPRQEGLTAAIHPSH
jgi:MFS family permease